VSLILKGKRATHIGVAVYTSGFPASSSFAKESASLNNGGALRGWCSSTNPIAPCCCSSRSRRQQKKLEGALLCKRRTSICGATEPAELNKLAQVVTIRLQFGGCLSWIQAEDCDEIFHSKFSKQIPRWYIKVRYDRILSRPLKFINHYHLIIRHYILLVI
jgi:hypothetical protein